MSSVYLGYMLFENGQRTLKAEDNAITEDFLAEIQEKTDRIKEFIYYSIPYATVMGNFNDLVHTIEDFEHNYGNSGDYRDCIVHQENINRHLANTLNSFYVYAERYDRKFANCDECKRNSDNKRITSKYCDDYFEYRFFYGLRNFTIHAKDPVGEIQSTRDNQQWHLVISKEHLLTSNKWRSALRKEIENMSGDITNVKSLIMKAMLRFCEMHREIVNPFINEMVEIAKFCISLSKTNDKGELNFPLIVCFTTDEKGSQKANIKDIISNNILALEMAMSRINVNLLTGKDFGDEVNYET